MGEKKLKMPPVRIDGTIMRGEVKGPWMVGVGESVMEKIQRRI